MTDREFRTCVKDVQPLLACPFPISIVSQYLRCVLGRPVDDEEAREFQSRYNKMVGPNDPSPKLFERRDG